MPTSTATDRGSEDVETKIHIPTAAGEYVESPPLCIWLVLLTIVTMRLEPPAPSLTGRFSPRAFQCLMPRAVHTHLYNPAHARRSRDLVWTG